MKKQILLTLGMAMLLVSGCTMTRQEKNPMKEPNGNIRVETATVKKFVAVSYSYETNVTSCSEVAFLTHVTQQDPSINNVYEIHWNQIENHKSFLGINGKRKYTCEFWGVGIQYGDPLPRSSNSQNNKTVVAVPPPPQTVVAEPTQVVEVAAPVQESAPAAAAPVTAEKAAETAPAEAKADSAKTEKAK